MHLIVDGYNLIRQSPELHRLDALEMEAGRAALLTLLADYRRRSPHKITVVFDGWQGGEPQETRDHHQGITIIYSRRGERADEVIKRLLSRERSRAVVVSSDREIQAWAQRVQATWVDAAHFEALYLVRQHVSTPDEDAEDEPKSRGPHKKGPARRLPKQQRQRRQRLKKL